MVPPVLVDSFEIDLGEGKDPFIGLESLVTKGSDWNPSRPFRPVHE